MSKSSKILRILFLAICIFCDSTFAKSFLWNSDYLLYIKSHFSESRFQKPYQDLIDKADRLLAQPAVSVMDKKFTPASGTKHDYMSLSRYEWPDSTKPDGLPYIRKDGLTNPEINLYDRNVLDKMSRNVSTLALAYYFSERESYAEAAIRQIEIWFLDDSTRMNPNMNFAQIIPGRNSNKGYPFGVLDGYSFVEMLDAIQWLEDSPSFSIQLKDCLKNWFELYLLWMQESEQGNQERQAKNNHGTTYDTQLLAYFLFVGNISDAQKLVKEFPKRLVQIHPDGSQPQELKRTLSFHYSWYNLNHILDFLIIAKNNALNIQPLLENSRHPFYKAFDFLIPYLGKKVSDWPYQQISGWENAQRNLLKDLFRIAAFLDRTKEDYLSLWNVHKKNLSEEILYSGQNWQSFE